MILEQFKSEQAAAVAALFKRVFAASEGEAAGASLFHLVQALMATTPAQDVYGFVARQQQEIIGSIFFSRFFLPSSQRAFILSPVAVATSSQGRRVGQSLINHGLDQLRLAGVDWVLTYGDPAYYSRVGFQKITVDIIPAPFALSQPEGWMAQSLGGRVPIEPVVGPSHCVPALMDEQYW